MVAAEVVSSFHIVIPAELPGLPYAGTNSRRLAACSELDVNRINSVRHRAARPLPILL